MKTTADYLDDLQEHFGVESDYALKNFTGWHLQHISRYRTLKSSFDDTTAQRVAGWLDVPLARVLIDMNAQRAKSDAIRKAWEHVAGLAAAVALVSILPQLISALPPEVINFTSSGALAQSVYYVKWFLPILAALFVILAQDHKQKPRS